MARSPSVLVTNVLAEDLTSGTAPATESAFAMTEALLSSVNPTSALSGKDCVPGAIHQHLKSIEHCLIN